MDPDRSGPTGHRSRHRRRRTSVVAEPSFDLLFSHSAILTFAGLALGVFASRKSFMIPLAVAATMAQEIVKERMLDRYHPRRA